MPELVQEGTPEWFRDLFLLQVRGQWPIYAVEGDLSAISQVRALAARNDINDLRQVRVWRVTALRAEEVQLQEEVVRAHLVPYGTVVTE